jgi:hypothetical protein
MLIFSRSAIIDKLERPRLSLDVGLAFIYFNYKERERQTLVNIVASLVQQLVSRSKAIPKDVRALYSHHQSRKTGPGETEYSEILFSLIDKFRYVYVVIDALDECDETRGSRTRFIKELLKLPAKVRLLCTSRHLGDIEKQFATASRLEIRASKADVERFLHAQISQTPRLLEFCTKFEDLRSLITNKLVENAKGMCVYFERFKFNTHS